MKYVYEKIKLPYKKLPHENQSKHKDYRQYYDTESIEIIAKKFQKEIELFNYTFDGKRP